MELQGYSNAETSTAFLKQLRGKYAGPLTVIWDKAPAHHGDAMRAYLATPGLRLRLVSLPGYSPDFNAAEAIWNWARRGHRELVLGHQNRGPGKVGTLLRPVGLPDGRSQALLSDHLASTGRGAPQGCPSQFLSRYPCRSHFGFGLGEPMILGWWW